MVPKPDSGTFLLLFLLVLTLTEPLRPGEWSWGRGRGLVLRWLQAGCVYRSPPTIHLSLLIIRISTEVTHPPAHSYTQDRPAHHTCTQDRPAHHGAPFYGHTDYRATVTRSYVSWHTSYMWGRGSQHPSLNHKGDHKPSTVQGPV